MSRTLWTAPEIAHLVRLYPDTKTIDLAATMGRKLSSVHTKAAAKSYRANLLASVTTKTIKPNTPVEIQMILDSFVSVAVALALAFSSLASMWSSLALTSPCDSLMSSNAW